MTIELPTGDYDRKAFAEFCERFGCKLQPSKKADKHLFVVSSDEAINFFWLGANMNFIYKSGIAESAGAVLRDRSTKK